MTVTTKKGRVKVKVQSYQSQVNQLYRTKFSHLLFQLDQVGTTITFLLILSLHLDPALVKSNKILTNKVDQIEQEINMLLT